MRFTRGQAAAWILIYVILATLPVAIAYTGSIPDARGFWIEFGVAIGFIGLAMMGLQFILTGRFSRVAGTLGLDSMLQFHRRIGLAAFLMILAHPVILIIADSQYLSFFDPRENLPRAFALVAVIGALVLLIVTTIWRQALRIPYEWWRAAHGVLALFIVFVGVVHILQVGFYVSGWWKQVIWVAATGAAMAMLINTRVVRPWQMSSKPYRVAEVRKERGDSWSLRFEPVGHPGMRFLPGQFGWLILGESPWTIHQHPFSFSSSAEETGWIELTIKELGDFTSTIGETSVGTTAYIEGPYGAFVPDDSPRQGMVCIAGGVGVTPIMSMLRTLADQNDPRPIILIYGNGERENILFHEELEALKDRLNVSIIYVLSRPDEAWDGIEGRLTPDIIGPYLPLASDDSREYFVCGPEGMMDSVEPFLAENGVPLADIYAERFQIV
jgi:predicted ferric reductase